MPALLPIGYERVRVVGSFEELIATPLCEGVNTVCWQRTLGGDFGEVVGQLATTDDITPIDETRLASLEVSPFGHQAVETLLGDLRLLRAAGHEPTLECVRRYPREPSIRHGGQLQMQAPQIRQALERLQSLVGDLCRGKIQINQAGHVLQ